MAKANGSSATELYTPQLKGSSLNTTNFLLHTPNHDVFYNIAIFKFTIRALCTYKSTKN